jgi:G3E family GTPase
VGMYYMLDAVVTVVDARHAMQTLDEHEEAQRQVGFADKILLSKTDLVDATQIAALRQRLSRMNPRATISTMDFGKIAIAEVLDLKGFNLNAKLELDPDFLLAEETHEHNREHHGCDDQCTHEHHTHGNEHEQNHHHARHSDDIAAFVFKSTQAFHTAKLDEFLGGLVQVFGPRMLRYKGVLLMEGADRKVIFQGVHQIMGTDVGAKWAEGELRESKMVFIGKNLPKDVFIQGLNLCLV